MGDAFISAATLGLPAEAMAEVQKHYLEAAGELWNRVLQPGAVAPALADRRFAGGEWAANATTRPGFTAGMYLLNARTLMRDGREPPGRREGRRRASASPCCNGSTPPRRATTSRSTPKCSKKAIDTQGESLMQGMRQLWNDVQQGHLSQTDESAFEVGRNVATSAGSVVFENEFFQLLEYAPLTAKVHERPILFVPPCINKFYILDLQPENSLIRHTVAEGHRVFVVSWKNAGDDIAQRTWDDYIEHAAIRAIEPGAGDHRPGADQHAGLLHRRHHPGHRIGGAGGARRAAGGEHDAAHHVPRFQRHRRARHLHRRADGEDARDDPRRRIPGGGALLKGQELATTFSFLRPNDLVWNYVVGNYLKGETPPPFDLLYWNSDGTNLPGPMYCWYLRNTYLENNLVQPNKVTVCGEKIDLGSIAAPTYVYASREDHIVPWQGAYRNTQVLKGKRRFVLGASGHIAGVINPPAKKKRSHWIGEERGAAGVGRCLARRRPTSFRAAGGPTGRPGSGRSPASSSRRRRRRATAPGKPIEPAPGRYVKERA